MSNVQFGLIKTDAASAGLKIQVVELIRKLYLFESLIINKKELDFNVEKLDNGMAGFLDKSSLCALAFADGDLVGILLNDKQDTEISILYVEEKFRSKSVGGCLVKLFTEYHKGKEVTVQCLEENPRARLFYEQLGFVFDSEPVKVGDAFNLLGRMANHLT